MEAIFCKDCGELIWWSDHYDNYVDSHETEDFGGAMYCVNNLQHCHVPGGEQD